MKRQRGLGIVGYLVGAGAIIAVLVGAYWIGYGHGAAKERNSWAEREVEEVTRLNAEIIRLEREAAEAERAHAAALADVSKRYQENLRAKERAHSAHVAALRAGALRLRDPEAPACEGAGGDGVPGAAAGAGRRDGAEDTGLLSKAASVFLLEEARRADEIVLQLQACQEVVRSDRAVAREER